MTGQHQLTQAPTDGGSGDSSRIARDIADAIRVMQTLKFLGVRVIYISQGIDSDSDQADALVAVHGLIDSLY